MVRSYRYRLRPTRAQERALFTWLTLTRELYNAALQERRDAYRLGGHRVTAYNQMHQLAGIREVRPEFNALPIVVLRGALRRLDRAFAGFFRRCKLGGKPGYPRFRSARRFNSILLDDLDKKNPVVCGGKRIAVPLLGKVKFKQHRPMEGIPKAMRLVLDADRWYVTLSCIDVALKPIAPAISDVGVDLGLIHFAATSDGLIFPNPRPLGVARLLIERAQRLVSRRRRGSKRRRHAALLLARHHAHVANVRRENHISTARFLVARYRTIYVEALNIRGLSGGMLAKSVNDAAWGNFLHWLRTKAEEAGCEVMEVDPRGTSQTCPACGQVVAKPLSQRIHRCDCGLVCDRDVAAAQVILGLGRSLRGAAPLVEGRQRSAKSKSTAADRTTPLATAGAI